MHYKDGTPANVGDIVKGPSFDNNGQPCEIVGIVVGSWPEATTCNLSVASGLNGMQHFSPVSYTPERGAFFTGYGKTNTVTAGEFEKLG